MIIAHGQLVASDTPDNLSKVLVASNTLELTIKGQHELVKNLLSKIEGIDSIEVHNSVEAGCADFIIKTGVDVDIREQVFDAMCEAKCPILKMSLSNMSLEDVFIQLTSDKKWILNKEKANKKKSFFSRKDMVKEEA